MLDTGYWIKDEGGTFESPPFAKGDLGGFLDQPLIPQYWGKDDGE